MTVTTGVTKQPGGLAATVVGFWLLSLAPVVVADSDLHGTSMAFWRCWIGFAAVGTAGVIRKSITWERLKQAIVPGFCFGSAIGLFFWASQITSIANASLLTVLHPIVAMIAGRYMFSERVTKRDVFLSLVAIGGAVMLVLAGDSSGTGDIRGDALATVSILMGASYFIVGKRVLTSVPVVPFMAGVFLWAGVWLAFTLAISRERVLPSADSDWIRIVVVSIVPGVGHLLLNFAQNKVTLNLMGVLHLIIPVSATILAYVFLDQTVAPLQAAGMALVIGALTSQALLRGRSPT